MCSMPSNFRPALQRLAVLPLPSVSQFTYAYPFGPPVRGTGLFPTLSNATGCPVPAQGIRFMSDKAHRSQDCACLRFWTLYPRNHARSIRTMSGLPGTTPQLRNLCTVQAMTVRPVPLTSVALCSSWHRFPRPPPRWPQAGRAQLVVRRLGMCEERAA